jgi:DNA-binding MarR family transcriptional regulator
MRTDNDVMAEGGPALFRLVRFWSRRWATGIGPGTEAEGAHVGQVLVLEAIDAASRTGSAQIADVAAELGLDRSNASRMLAAAVAAGLVTRAASAQDARRSELSITPAGRELLSAARDWQAQTFTELTAEWPAADARRFAGYLVRLANQEQPKGKP